MQFRLHKIAQQRPTTMGIIGVGEKSWKNRIDLSSLISVKSNNKENVVTTKIFNKKFSGNAKEASGTGAGHGGKHHFRKLCRKKSRSWKSWFEGKDLTVSSSSNNDQYYALLPLDESERSSDLGKKFWEMVRRP